MVAFVQPGFQPACILIQVLCLCNTTVVKSQLFAELFYLSGIFTDGRRLHISCKNNQRLSIYRN
ncbi:hypothetical protein D3C72_646860 [compost metagenome]